MIINEKEVKEVKTENGTEYDYFACQCKKEDKEFFDNLLSKHSESSGSKENYPTSKMFFELMANGWYVTTIFADQWALVTLANEEHGDTMRIQCDIIEHGLAVAVLIAEHLDK